MKQFCLKIQNLICEYSRQTVGAFFAFLLIFGIAFAPSYGVNYDFESEEYILMTNLKAICEKIAPETTEKVHTFSNLPKISEYKEKDHGKAVFYPIGALKLAISPTANTYYKCYHIYTFLVNYVGIIFLYLIAKMIFKRRKFALLSVLMFVFNPRIFADCFYNDKDMAFCSLLIITAYFAFKTLENKSSKVYPIFLGIFSAFACNTRVIGLVVPFLCLCVYIWDIIKAKKYKDIKSYLSPLIAISVCVVTFIVITPATWDGLVDYFEYTLSSSADFTRWNGTVYYLGDYYDLTQVDLPWHYLPVTIFVTSPLLITLFFITGVMLLIKYAVKKEFKSIDRYVLILLFASIIPVVFAILNGSRLYNGWRHFYFIYPALVITGFFGISQLLKVKKTTVKKCTVAVLCLFVLTGTLNFVRYSNHGYAYYSVGSNYFEGDYWNVSSVECMEKLLDKTEGEIKIIASDFHSSAGLHSAVNYLPNSDKERVIICQSIDEADYIFTNPTYYNIAKNTDKEYISIDNSSQIVNINAGKQTLTAVYSNTHGE